MINIFDIITKIIRGQFVIFRSTQFSLDQFKIKLAIIILNYLYNIVIFEYYRALSREHHEEAILFVFQILKSIDVRSSASWEFCAHSFKIIFLIV